MKTRDRELKTLSVNGNVFGNKTLLFGPDCFIQTVFQFILSVRLVGDRITVAKADQVPEIRLNINRETF